MSAAATNLSSSIKKNIFLPESPSETAILLLLAATILFIHINLYEYAFDDAFIHFRVARNFLENGAPYFNINEIIKVSTSSVWTILLTIILYLERALASENNLPFIVSIINSLFTFLGMRVYTGVINRLLERPLTLVTSTLYQITYVALIVPSSIGLMETPLAILIAGIGIYLLADRKRETFIFLALAAYIRIELIVLVILCAGVTFLQKKLSAFEIILHTGIGSVPFVIYDLVFFNTIIPHSIYAKSVLYSITSVETMGRIIFFTLPLRSLIADNMSALITSLVLLAGLLILSGSTSLAFWQTQRNTLPFMFFAWSVSILGLYIWRHVLVFEWYMPLYTIPLVTMAAISLKTLKSSQKTIAASLFYPLAFVCSFFVIHTFVAGIFSPAGYVQFESGSRVKTYRAVAEMLYEEYPDATLLSSEIGGLGYEFKGYILDAAGLASLDALDYHPMKVPEERTRGDLGAIPPKFVEKNLPEIIVSYDGFGMALLNSATAQEYTVLALPAYLSEDAVFSKTNEIWGSKYLRVYIRKNLSVSIKLLELADE